MAVFEFIEGWYNTQKPLTATTAALAGPPKVPGVVAGRVDPTTTAGHDCRIAKQEGATLRALVEEGLQRSLEARRHAVRRALDFPSYGGSGLTEAFQGAPWSRIRDEVYREHGA